MKQRREGPEGPSARVCAWIIGLLLAGACAPMSSSQAGGTDTVVPATLSDGSLNARAPGCWVLAWALPADARTMEGVELPDSISLADPPLFGTRGRLVTPATHPEGRGFDREAGSTEPPTWEMRYRSNRWWVEGEIVEIVFTEETSAFWSLRLALDGEALRGAAGFYEREGSARSLTASVAAHRMTCGFGPG